MEAIITLGCDYYSEDMKDILEVFQRVGWNLFNRDGMIEYLPLGDKDEYNWTSEKISKEQFYDMVTLKTRGNEQIGINLYHDSSEIGISLLALNTKQVILGLGINRKVINKGHTDMVWYLENIVYKLWDINVQLSYYKLEEIQD